MLQWCFLFVSAYVYAMLLVSSRFFVLLHTNNGMQMVVQICPWYRSIKAFPSRQYFISYIITKKNMEGKFKMGDAVAFKKLNDKKIIQVDEAKGEALCEGLNKKNEKKTVWIPLRLLKLQKEKAPAVPGQSEV